MRVHWILAIVASRLSAICGSAIFRIDTSITTMKRPSPTLKSTSQGLGPPTFVESLFINSSFSLIIFGEEPVGIFLRLSGKRSPKPLQAAHNFRSFVLRNVLQKIRPESPIALSETCVELAALFFETNAHPTLIVRIRPLFHQSVSLHLIHDDRDVALGETISAADPAHAHAGFPPNLAEDDDLGQGKPRGLTPSGHMLLNNRRTSSISSATRAAFFSCIASSENRGTQNIFRDTVSYTHLRAHETKANLVCRLL